MKTQEIGQPGALALGSGWALLMLLSPETGRAGCIDSGPADQMHARCVEMRAQYGDNVWCTSNRPCFDADGLPISVGQELLDPYGDMVSVVSFCPEGIEVKKAGEPSEVIEASDLRRISPNT